MNVLGAKKLFVSKEDFAAGIDQVKCAELHVVDFTSTPTTGGTNLTVTLNDGTVVGPVFIPNAGAQTLSFVDPDLTIAGGNTVDISDVNYWDELAGDLTYVSGNVGIGTAPFVPAYEFHVQGDTQLEGLLYDNGGNAPVGQFLSQTISGIQWVPSPASGLTWFEITGTSSTLAVNSGYIANNAGLITFTLPAASTLGDTIRVVGKGTGGWRINQLAGQTIYFGDEISSTGVAGSLASDHYGDCVTMTCITNNNDWRVTDSLGELTIT